MGNWKSKWFSAFMVAVLLFGGLWPGLGIDQAKAAGPTIIYVKMATDGGDDGKDGASWGSAFATLQQALDKAKAGEQIWMAAGTYYPTGNGIERYRHFEMKNDVAIYGGFVGNEDLDFSLDMRNYTTNKTILSGDFDGSNANKAYHVFFHKDMSLDHAILDGVTITGGYANGGGEQNNGGGMYNGNSSPTLTNVTISGNMATKNGGGMYNYTSSLTLTNVTISENASSYEGGGLYNIFSSPTLTNVTISGNKANVAGGGMSNVKSSPTLTSVTISGNTTTNWGGGMFNNDNSSPTLTNVKISGNKSSFGGGGMYNVGASSPTLTNVTIIGNRSLYRDGGGMLNKDNSNPNIRNSIVWGNTSTSGRNVFNDSSNPNINHSLIEGSRGSDNTWDTVFGVDGGGNIDKNPIFQEPAITNPTTEGNYGLRSYSPAINTGDNSVFADEQNPDLSGIHTDPDGKQRIVGSQVDMGAYEYQGSATTIIELKASPAPVKMRLDANNIQQLSVKATLSDMTLDDITSSSLGTTYMSGDITVATVTANGLIEAKNLGTTTITIANSGITTTVQVNITSITELEASPAPVNLRLGQTNSQQMSVKATLSDTTTEDVTSQAKGTTYTSGDTTVATVTANGLIEAKKVGTTTITIANSGITTSVEVNVTSTSSGGGWIPSGDTHLRELIVRADGKTLPLTPVFVADTTQYRVETAALQVDLTGIAVHPSAIVTLQGKTLKDGIRVDLQEGDNVLALIVTAENGVTKTYTLTVKRMEPPRQPASFTDIDGHWAEVMIRQAVTKDILSGYPDGTFRPNHSVTRAEFVVMLVNTMQSIHGGDTSSQNSKDLDASPAFTDADTIGAWAKEAVAYAVQAGIINGYKDGSFRPNARITRAEMAMMIADALGQPIDEAVATGFTDDKVIPEWVKSAVAAIKKLGIITGKGMNKFAPDDQTTRAEAVTVLLRMMEQKSK